MEFKIQGKDYTAAIKDIIARFSQGAVSQEAAGVEVATLMGIPPEHVVGQELFALAIMKERNAFTLLKGYKLGAIGYTIFGPSSGCQPGCLKEKVGYSRDIHKAYKQLDERAELTVIRADAVVPPCHARCKCWTEMLIEGLTDQEELQKLQ